MIKLLMVGAGGFLGAIARYSLSSFVQNRLGMAFPWGTLSVNVLGCFLIGTLMSLVELKMVMTPHVRLLVITGFLGALTTFSTFGYETVQLYSRHNLLPLFLNIAANLLLGIGAVLGGRALGKIL